MAKKRESRKRFRATKITAVRIIAVGALAAGAPGIAQIATHEAAASFGDHGYECDPGDYTLPGGVTRSGQVSGIQVSVENCGHYGGGDYKEKLYTSDSGQIIDFMSHRNQGLENCNGSEQIDWDHSHTFQDVTAAVSWGNGEYNTDFFDCFLGQTLSFKATGKFTEGQSSTNFSVDWVCAVGGKCFVFD